jgi:hypothetical protein
MAISNSTTLNDLVGQIVSNEAQSAAYSSRIGRNLVHSVMVPQGAGSIVIPRFQGLTAALLTEGTAPNSTTWSTDGVTLTPVERGVYVQIAKRALYADPFSDLAPYGEQMGRALANDEDAQILANCSGKFSTVIASGTWAAAPKTAFLSAISSLEASGAVGPFYGVFHPQVWSDLRVALGDASTYAAPGTQIVEGFGEGLTNMNGYVGSPFGVPCFISTKLPKYSDLYYNGVFSKEAIGYAYMQDITVDVFDNKVARAFDLMGWYAGHSNILIPGYGVEIQVKVV